MKTTVKKLSATRVLVTVAAGQPELETAEQVALKRMAKKIKVNGFRQGHVPIAVVEKHADPHTLSQETLEAAINRAVAEAFLSNKLQVLDRPEVLAVCCSGTPRQQTNCKYLIAQKLS